MAKHVVNGFISGGAIVSVKRVKAPKLPILNKFRLDQSRAPRGAEGGGRWVRTSSGGNAGVGQGAGSHAAGSTSGQGAGAQHTGTSGGVSASGVLPAAKPIGSLGSRPTSTGRGGAGVKPKPGSGVQASGTLPGGVGQGVGAGAGVESLGSRPNKPGRGGAGVKPKPKPGVEATGNLPGAGVQATGEMPDGVTSRPKPPKRPKRPQTPPKPRSKPERVKPEAGRPARMRSGEEAFPERRSEPMPPKGRAKPASGEQREVPTRRGGPFKKPKTPPKLRQPIHAHSYGSPKRPVSLKVRCTECGKKAPLYEIDKVRYEIAMSELQRAAQSANPTPSVFPELDKYRADQERGPMGDPTGQFVDEGVTEMDTGDFPGDMGRAKPKKKPKKPNRSNTKPDPNRALYREMEASDPSSPSRSALGLPPRRDAQATRDTWARGEAMPADYDWEAGATGKPQRSYEERRAELGHARSKSQKYRRDQLRAPQGEAGGGRWVDEAGTAGVVAPPSAAFGGARPGDHVSIQHFIEDDISTHHTWGIVAGYSADGKTILLHNGKSIHEDQLDNQAPDSPADPVMIAGRASRYGWRWDANGPTGRFAKPEGSARIDKDHRVYWTNPNGGAFAQGYVAAAHEAGGRSTRAGEARAQAFRDTYEEVSHRSGFAGSGEATYRHKETGRYYHVERMAGGKSFFDTVHTVTELPATWTPPSSSPSPTPRETLQIAAMDRRGRSPHGN